MSFYFDGSNDSMGNTTTPPVVTYPFSVAAWFKRADTTATNYSLFQIGAYDPTVGLENDNAFSLFTSTTGAVVARARVTTNYNATTTTTALDTNWNHACGVFASSTSRFAYLNGGGKFQSTNSSSPSGVDNCRIGCYFDNSLDMYGYIAHIAVWDDVLSDSEVLALYEGANPLAITPASGAVLVAYWPMQVDESPAVDVVSGYNLTLYNQTVYNGANDPAVDPPPATGSKYLKLSQAPGTGSTEKIYMTWAPAE